MIKAIIFDMDGTTVDSIKSITHFVNQTMKKFGYDTISVEKCKQLVGHGAKSLIKSALNEVCADFENFDKIFESYRNAYDSNPCYLAESYDGILEMLTQLKDKGIKLGILSNKTDKTVQKINSAVFGTIFDVCQGDIEGVPLKPDPTSLLEMIKGLGIEKDEVLYVGDTNVDIFTAKNAGVLSIGVLWGFRDENELKTAGADYIVKSPAEILSIALDKLS